MRYIVATILAFNCCFIQAQVDWELRFSGDVWNVAFGENHDFLTTRTSVFRSDAGLNEWTECNWTLGIVREGTSIVNGLSWNNDRLVVAALDNGYFMSSDLGESFVQTGPTGFGCASESILDIEGGALVATMGGFQRGLWKCEAPPSTYWNKNYSVGADQRDIQQIGEDLFAVSHASNHPGGILRSSDFGGSWDLVFATEFFGNPSCFSVIGDLFIFISWDGEVHHIDMLDWTEVATFETELLDASDMCEIDGALFLSRRNGGVYRSEDLGQTWVDVGPSTSSFYIVKKEGEELYAAGESGLWAMPLANFNSGCTDESACNFDAAAVQDDGSCTYPEIIYSPCGDCYTDCSGNIINDWDGDGICDDGIDIPVCSDPSACNYDPDNCGLYIDFGICIYPEVISTPCGDCLTDCFGNILNDFDGDGICDDGAKNYGCPDPMACNYAGPCVTDVAPCDYPPQYYNCDFECNSDSDGDGTCDELEVLGCTSIVACNFSPTATEDDGTCEYGACHCLEGTIWDEEQGGCVVANPSDTDFDGCVSMTDLLDLLSVFGTCEETSWSCGEQLEYQGYDYETVQIGEQCWFAENLRAEQYSNGDPIPMILDDAEWQGSSEGARCWINNDSTFFGFPGFLYHGYAVTDNRGVCPEMWHVANDLEWMALEIAHGLSEFEAHESGIRGGDIQLSQKMRVESWGGTNELGFAAQKGGYRRWENGSFSGGIDSGAYWSNGDSLGGPGYREFHGPWEGVARGEIGISEGLSIRCIQDSE